MARSSKIFISYSWDTPAHSRWVEKIALQLVVAGVDVVLDQWHLKPGESLTSFMERGIRNSSKVLVVCTPNYAKRSNTRRGGVGYEQQIISGRIASGIARKKFVPIVKKGALSASKNGAFPAHFDGIFALDFRTNRSARNNFPVLLKELGGQRNRTAFSSAKGKPSAGPSRLPDPKVEGYRLSSGVLSNQLHSKTFSIPSEHERRNVRVGDLVKLIFDFEFSNKEESYGERMWVRVTGWEGPYFRGILANQPLSYVGRDQRKLKFGSSVIFLPEHIVDIERA